MPPAISQQPESRVVTPRDLNKIRFDMRNQLNRKKTPPNDFIPQSAERLEHEGKSLLVGVKVVSQIRMNATDNHLRPHDEMGLHRDQCFP
jgi:hypothetical protein